MDSQEFYDYIMKRFNLNGTAERLVKNIIEYVRDQEFVDAQDAQVHLKSLLDGAFGMEEREYKLYRAPECELCGEYAPYPKIANVNTYVAPVTPLTKGLRRKHEAQTRRLTRKHYARKWRWKLHYVRQSHKNQQYCSCLYRARQADNAGIFAILRQ